MMTPAWATFPGGIDVGLPHSAPQLVCSRLSFSARSSIVRSSQLCVRLDVSRFGHPLNSWLAASEVINSISKPVC